MPTKPLPTRLVFGVVISVCCVACGAERVEQEANGDGGPGCLSDPDSGAEGGSAGSLGEAGNDVVVDTAHLEDCPDEMVEVGVVCVDIYEASRPDATAQDQGSAVGPAGSVPGVIPWHASPMDLDRLAEFEAACAAAGKRLCRPSELLATCAGPSGAAYVFGSNFDPETCNCVDTFCDDWCAENGVAPGSCSTGANCGYAYDCFHVMPTGSFPGCTNELGTFDVTGNVWEVVSSNQDPRGFEVRGGAYNCAGAEERLKCTFNATWVDLFAGFRCCQDRLP